MTTSFSNLVHLDLSDNEMLEDEGVAFLVRGLYYNLSHDATKSLAQ